MSSSTLTTTKTTELHLQLASLGLSNIADNLDDFLARAAKQKLSPRQLLEQLARIEVDDKGRRSLERRFKRSKIGRFKPIADFDWNWPKNIDRGAIESALTLDFIHEGRNFIMLGTNGLGKTMLLKNIADHAVRDGFSVLVRTASDILDELDSDSPELRRQRLRKYLRPKLLCIDELGYLAYDENAADLLFHIVNSRYDARRSIVLTTNLAFKDWNTVFPNATCIATLLDRLTHHADVTVVEGKSYRVRESEQENAERKQKRRQKTTST
jgi:DNA replication protein DnaC